MILFIKFLRRFLKSTQIVGITPSIASSKEITMKNIISTTKLILFPFILLKGVTLQNQQTNRKEKEKKRNFYVRERPNPPTINFSLCQEQHRAF